MGQNRGWRVAMGGQVTVSPEAGYSVVLTTVDNESFTVRVVKDPPGVLDCLLAAKRDGFNSSRDPDFLTCPLDRCADLELAMRAVCTHSKSDGAATLDLRPFEVKMAAGEVGAWGVPVFPGTRFGSGTFAPEMKA